MPLDTASAVDYDDNDQKRRRVSRACDLCRRKKVKCDGVLPVCTNCQILHLGCTYKDTAKKRGPPKGYIDAIESKLLRVEKLLDELTDVEGCPRPQIMAELDRLRHSEPIIKTKKAGHPHSAAEGRLRQTETRSPSPPHYSPPLRLGSQRSPSPIESQPSSARPGVDTPLSYGPYQREAVQESNVAMFNLSIDEQGNQRYCGQSSGLWLLRGSSRFQGGILQGSRANLRSHTCPYTDVTQVPREIELALVRGFFEHIYPVFPIVIPHQFWNSFVDPSEDPPSPLLKYAMFACVAKFVDLDTLMPGGSNAALGMLYFDTLQPGLLAHLFTSSLTLVQVLVLVAVYHHGCMTMKGWKFNGMAINLAYDLGLHRDPDKMGMLRMSDTDRELRRRAWWCCYILDTIGSASLGRPPVVKGMGFDTEYCRLEENPAVVAGIIDGSITGPIPADLARASPTSSSPVPPGQPSPELPFTVERHSKYLLLLINLVNRTMGQVYGYQSVFVRNYHHPIVFSIPVAQLDKQLRTWLINLPPELKYNPSDYLQLGRAPHRFIGTIHSLYHNTLILLHRPFLAHQWHLPVLAVGSSSNQTMAAASHTGDDGAESAGPVLGPAVLTATPSPLNRHRHGTAAAGGSPGVGSGSNGSIATASLTSAEFSSLQICTSSSAALTCIQHTMARKSSSGGSIFNISMNMAAATLHLHNALSPDPRYARAAKAYLRLTLDTLRVLGKRWISASKLEVVLKELMEQRGVSLEGVPQVTELTADDNLGYALAVNPAQFMDDVSQPPNPSTSTVPKTVIVGANVHPANGWASTAPMYTTLSQYNASNQAPAYDSQRPHAQRNSHPHSPLRMLSTAAHSSGLVPKNKTRSDSALPTTAKSASHPIPPAARGLARRLDPTPTAPVSPTTTIASRNGTGWTPRSDPLRAKVMGGPGGTATTAGTAEASYALIGSEAVFAPPGIEGNQTTTVDASRPPLPPAPSGHPAVSLPPPMQQDSPFHTGQVLWTNLMEDPNFNIGLMGAAGMNGGSGGGVSTGLATTGGDYKADTGAQGGGGGLGTAVTVPFELLSPQYFTDPRTLHGAGGNVVGPSGQGFVSQAPQPTPPSSSTVGANITELPSYSSAVSGPIQLLQMSPAPSAPTRFDPYAVYGAATGANGSGGGAGENNSSATGEAPTDMTQQFNLAHILRQARGGGNKPGTATASAVSASLLPSSGFPGMSTYNSTYPVHHRQLQQPQRSDQANLATSSARQQTLPMGELSIDCDGPDSVLKSYPVSQNGSHAGHNGYVNVLQRASPAYTPPASSSSAAAAAAAAMFMTRQAPTIIPAGINGANPVGRGIGSTQLQTSSSSLNPGSPYPTPAPADLGNAQPQPQQSPFIPTRGQNQAFFTNLENFFFDADVMEFNTWDQVGPSQ
ncbi:hypothetical protein IWQ60_009915 [Tieghemiomyces parasiticus]|uniref:Zn(2)-C6 fungal-type domain-containing protein n=1 Tax=Tieghemiomyces parasiticus TaxID=78921 RepID=A0A9W8DJ56_9FUNG|nr:hypothetical protein IWQ60_009915 [Tieghemiomyces parasiticus]